MGDLPRSGSHGTVRLNFQTKTEASHSTAWPRKYQTQPYEKHSKTSALLVYYIQCIQGVLDELHESQSSHDPNFASG